MYGPRPLELVVPSHRQNCRVAKKVVGMRTKAPPLPHPPTPSLAKVKAQSYPTVAPKPQNLQKSARPERTCVDLSIKQPKSGPTGTSRPIRRPASMEEVDRRLHAAKGFGTLGVSGFGLGWPWDGHGLRRPWARMRRHQYSSGIYVGLRVRRNSGGCIACSDACLDKEFQ